MCGAATTVAALDGPTGGDGSSSPASSASSCSSLYSHAFPPDAVAEPGGCRSAELDGWAGRLRATVEPSTPHRHRRTRVPPTRPPHRQLLSIILRPTKGTTITAPGDTMAPKAESSCSSRATSINLSAPPSRNTRRLRDRLRTRTRHRGRDDGGDGSQAWSDEDGDLERNDSSTRQGLHRPSPRITHLQNCFFSCPPFLVLSRGIAQTGVLRENEVRMSDEGPTGFIVHRRRFHTG